MATRIILDCDPGHDDAIALLLALGSPEVQLVGVTTVAGNQTIEKTTANALRVLEHVGAEVPVARGAERPLVRERFVADYVHGESGLDGPELPPAEVVGWPLDRSPFALETSVPGVFAAGDVRLDSMKRVASAVGEGAMAVYLVHRYLATV